MPEYHFLDRLVTGTRPGFGEGNQAIRLASAAALRRRSNWVLPGGMGLLLIGAVILTHLGPVGSGAQGFAHFFFRVVAVDYLVFFFGWLCGWNAAARWRRDQSFIEELVMTSLRPGVVGNLLFAGGLSVWSRLLALVMIVDVAVLVATPDRLSLGRMEGEGVVQIVGLILSLPVYLALAWFHLETLRIAYWMFAAAALPKLNLLNKAMANFFLIPVYVIVLTMIGSMLTGVLSVVLAGILMAVTISNAAAPDPFASHLAWAIGTLPGLLLVGLIKRAIAGQYEVSFWRDYLLYGWYGAGEREHPRVYPLHMFQQLGVWLSFLRAEEKLVAARAKPEAPDHRLKMPDAPRSGTAGGPG